MLDTFLRELSTPAGGTAMRLADRDIMPEIGLGPDASQTELVVQWEVRGPHACTLRISPALVDHQRVTFAARRLRGVWPLLEAFHNAGAPAHGCVNINLQDHTVRPGLSFCGADNHSFLIPDAVFLNMRGYADTRAKLASGGPPWQERRPCAIWRGATTGIGKGNWHVLPRIHLCQLSLANPDWLDAAVTHIVQLPPTAEAEIRQAGLMRPPMPVHEFANWRYQIDIDGNTSSWPGLFQKLLTGSPVVKIASPRGWKQWYYDRLQPWVNYVPAEAGLEDLMEKLSWLREHEAEAIAIGQAGRQLALSLTYESEIEAAVPVMAAAIDAAERARASSA